MSHRMFRNRPAIDLSRGWRFIAQRRLSGSGPEAGRPVMVDLPHCWNTQDTFRDGVAYWRGAGAYRREITVPVDAPSDRVWQLESDGFYGLAYIQLNGNSLGVVDGEYMGFSVDVTEALKTTAPNQLLIELSNRHNRRVLPGIPDPDFILYGGLAGAVRLRSLPTVRVDEQSLRITAPDGPATPQRVTIRFAVRNDGAAPARCRAAWDVFDTDGTRLAQADALDVMVPPRSLSQGHEARLRLEGVGCWSPDEPRLYRARCRLESDAGQVDEIEERFGLRTAEFTDKGFFLNGEPLILRGCNRHENMPGFGNALPAALHRQDARAIKDMGFNFVRLSHYPQSPAFLDACDELGLMVYAELTSWKRVRTGSWLKAAERQMRRLVCRDRDRPSVMLWGMGNEARSRKAYLHLYEAIKDEDPSRPVTYAENHLYRARRKRTVGIPDVWSVNYETEVVPEAAQHARLGAVLVSECANWPQARRGCFEEELNQVRRLQACLSDMAAYPGLSGYAVWSFADYATMRKARYARHCGVVDHSRHPKMAAAFHRVAAGEHPVLEAYAADETTDAGRRIAVIASAPVSIRHGGLELFAGDGPVVEGCVPADCLDVEIAPTSGGNGAIHLSLREASRLLLELVQPLSEATGASVATLLLRALDEQQRLAATWSGEVTVTAERPGRVICHDPENRVRVAHGTALVYAAPGNDQTTLRVTARHPGLGETTCDVESAATS